MPPCIGRPAVNPVTTPILGYQATSVHVTNIEKARPFYTKLLGFKEVGYNPEVKAAYFEVPGSTIPLSVHQFDHGCAQTGGRPPGTVSGIVFTVKNTEQAVAELQKRGVKVTDPAHKVPWGAVMATIADPDNNEFVLSTK